MGFALVLYRWSAKCTRTHTPTRTQDAVVKEQDRNYTGKLLLLAIKTYIGHSTNISHLNQVWYLEMGRICDSFTGYLSCVVVSSTIEIVISWSSQSPVSYDPIWGRHGDGLLVAGLLFTDYPPSWEKIPPV